MKSRPAQILVTSLAASVLVGCQRNARVEPSSQAILIQRMFEGYEVNDTSLWKRHVAPEAACAWNTRNMSGTELVDALGSAHEIFRDLEVDGLQIETIDLGNDRFLTPTKADRSATVIATGIHITIPCQMWIEWDGSTIVSFQEVFDNEIVTRALSPGDASIEIRLAESAAERSGIVERSFEATTLPAAIFGSVTRDGRLEFLCHGTHGPDDDRPVDEDSLFLIASMTKAITAVAALQMVEQGRI